MGLKFSNFFDGGLKETETPTPAARPAWLGGAPPVSAHTAPPCHSDSPDYPTAEMPLYGPHMPLSGRLAPFLYNPTTVGLWSDNGHYDSFIPVLALFRHVFQQLGRLWAWQGLLCPGQPAG